MTTRSAVVASALATRLESIKVAAGYDLDVMKVFYPLQAQQFQPMATELPEHEMPAILIYQGPTSMDPIHGQLDVRSQFHLELVRPWCPDSAMWDMVGAVGKAVFGGSADATENSAYRFHPAVVEPRMVEVIPDFGMLPSHRIWVVVLLVHYRVRYTNI